MKIENFMQALKEYQSPLVFNPWRDYDLKCDISSDAPVIRAANLTRYLHAYTTPTAIPSGILCKVTANTIMVVRPSLLFRPSA